MRKYFTALLTITFTNLLIFSNAYSATVSCSFMSETTISASGEWLKLQLSTALPFGSVKVIGRNGFDTQAADNWVILASNDNSSWTDLHSGTTPLTYNSGNGHLLTFSNTTSYSYYAILTKSIPPKTTLKGIHLAKITKATAIQPLPCVISNTNILAEAKLK